MQTGKASSSFVGGLKKSLFLLTILELQFQATDLKVNNNKLTKLKLGNRIEENSEIELMKKFCIFS